MLTYLGTGTREYGDRPLRPISRSGWEFQAVLRGSISLVTPQGPDVLRQRRLWLSRPGGTARLGRFAWGESGNCSVSFHGGAGASV